MSLNKSKERYNKRKFERIDNKFNCMAWIITGYMLGNVLIQAVIYFFKL